MKFRCLYAIFSGHGDSKVAEIALERISAEILLGQLIGKTTEDEIKDVLRQAFLSGENGYMDWAGNFLAQKAMLQAELKGVSQYEVQKRYNLNCKTLFLSLIFFLDITKI